MKLDIQWPLVLFSLIAGIGGSFFLFLALPVALFGIVPEGFHQLVIVSMAISICGGLCSVFHLARLQNSVYIASRLFSFSGITVEVLLLGISIILMLVNYFLVGDSQVDIAGRIAAGIGVVFSLALAFFCGHGYVMPGRPEWDTNLLPASYLGTSLACGGFLLACIWITVYGTTPEVSSSSPWILAAAIICAVTCLTYGLHVRKTVNDAQSSVKEGIERALESGVQEETESKASQAVTRGKIIMNGGLFACGVCVSPLCALILALMPESVIPMGILSLAGFCATLLAGLSVRTLMWEVGRCYLPLFDMSKVGVSIK